MDSHAHDQLAAVATSLLIELNKKINTGISISPPPIPTKVPKPPTKIPSANKLIIEKIMKRLLKCFN